MVTQIEYVEIPKLKDIIFIQGIAPGVGYVGRNVAGYIIYALDATKFAEVYSDSLPPVVSVDHERGGMIIPIRYEMYYYKGNKRKKEPHLVIMIGDGQPVTTEGYYDIAFNVLDFLDDLFGIKEVISIGGFGTGNLIEGRKPKVFGATNDREKIEKFEKHGVIFKDSNVTQIVGSAGVILSEATRLGIPATCLMGETSGLLMSDPMATESVLEILKEYLNLKNFDLSKIHEHVREVEKVIKKIEEMERAALEQIRHGKFKESKGKDVDKWPGYIG